MMTIASGGTHCAPAPFIVECGRRSWPSSDGFPEGLQEHPSAAAALGTPLDQPFYGWVHSLVKKRKPVSTGLSNGLSQPVAEAEKLGSTLKRPTNDLADGLPALKRAGLVTL